MVGEIRDLETAQIAVQAALTGHLVLSTLHTNSAAATVTRLRDMGLEDYLLTAVLRGVLAQRLVRRLCPPAGAPAPAPPELVAALRPRPALRRRGPITLCHPVGCPECRGTGYRGRLAIAEFLLLEPDDRAADLRARRPHRDRARRGRRPACDRCSTAGLDAVLAGETTIEEVVRSIRSGGLSRCRHSAISRDRPDGDDRCAA